MHRSKLVFGVLILAMTSPSSAQGRPYQAIDLGVPIGQSPIAGVGAECISPNGDHVGGYSVWEPFVWSRSVGMRALQKAAGDGLAQVNGVDDLGNGIGSSGTLLGGNRAVTWTPNGAVRLLHQASWSSSFGVGITNSGRVLVNARIGSTSVGRSIAFTGTLMGPLTTVAPNATNSIAFDINEAGQLCLMVDDLPFRLTPGIGLEPVGPFQPERLNDLGQMAGLDPSNGALMRRTDGVGWENLGRAPVGNFRDVGGIDSFGRIVVTEYVRSGISPPTYFHFGYLHVDGLGLRKLDDLVLGSQPVRVYTVRGITDDGNIACWGSFGPNNRALLLEPRFVASYGNGCAGGAGRQPKATADGMPAAGNRIVLLGSGGVANGTALFLIAASPAAVNLPGGCNLLADAASGLAIAVSTGGTGQASVSFNLPSNLPAGSVYAQFITLDTGAANGVFATSNGVRIDVQR
ncbi:MAG: hypothetical protein AB7I19_12835 [Planctomycetota bacterium]